jgi:hypothetical protein
VKRSLSLRPFGLRTHGDVGSLGCGDLTPAAQALIKINEAAEARLYAEIGTWSSAGGHCPRNETSLVKDFLSWLNPALNISPKPIPTL